jgi:hypothetical protein
MHIGESCQPDARQVNGSGKEKKKPQGIANHVFTHRDLRLKKKLVRYS